MRRWLEAARGRWLAGALVAVGVAMLASALRGERGLARVAGLGRELADTNERNFQLLQEISRLRRQLERVRTDDAALERIARRRLSLVRDGEVLYRVATPARRAAGSPAAATAAGEPGHAEERAGGRMAEASARSAPTARGAAARTR